jgi:hypothetical protein
MDDVYSSDPPKTTADLEKAENFMEDTLIEKRVVRKLDWNLTALVMVLYLLAFIDRSNIGNANTAGM